MTSAIEAMLATMAIVAFNVVTGSAIAGVGLAIRRAFGLRQRSIDGLFTSFWIGYAALQTFLVIWNFVSAVRPAVYVGLVIVGAAGLLWTRRDPFESEPAWPRWTVWCSIALCVWVAHLSLAPLTYWDSALYHMQAVRWAAEYPAVPGLANLFGPLGFNSAVWLYDAMVNVGPWSGASWHVSNGLFISVLGVELLVAAGRLACRETLDDGRQIFALLLLPVVVNSALDGQASSYATVVPATLAMLAATLIAHRALTGEHTDERERAFALFASITVGAAGVAIKSSAAVFAAALSAVLVFTMPRLVRDRALRRRTIRWCATAVAVVGLSWAARGVVLSGYPLFPSSAFGMPVDWKVPEEHARAEFDFVRHSALATAETFQFVSGEATGIRVWFRHWARSALNHLYSMAVPGLLGFGFFAALIVVFRRAGPARRRATQSQWLLLAPPLVAAVAWWIVAPMPRYGTGFFWLVAAGIGSQVYRLSEGLHARRRLVLAAALIIGFSPVVVTPAWDELQSSRSPDIVSALIAANLKRPDPGMWYATTPRPTDFESFTTASGLVLTVPTQKFGRCWYEPLPCTPNPAPNLRLRVPGRFDRGFTVDGDWQMIGWPEPWRGELLPAMRRAWSRQGLQ